MNQDSNKAPACCPDQSRYLDSPEAWRTRYQVEAPIYNIKEVAYQGGRASWGWWWG